MTATSRGAGHQAAAAPQDLIPDLPWIIGMDDHRGNATALDLDRPWT